MRDSRTYAIRREILKGLDEINPAPCDFDDILDMRQMPFLKPTREEVLKQWNDLIARGYVKTLDGSGGEYVVITAKGRDQINGETDKDPFIWGKFGLKTLCLTLAAALIALCSGCASLKDKAVTVYHDVNGAKVSAGGTSDAPIPSFWFGWFTSMVSTLPIDDDTRFVFFKKQDSTMFNSADHAGSTLIVIEGKKGASAAGATAKITISPETVIDFGVVKFGMGEPVTKVELISTPVPFEGNETGTPIIETRDLGDGQ